MELKDFIKKLKELEDVEVLAFDDRRGDYFKPEIDQYNGKYFITGRKREKSE